MKKSKGVVYCVTNTRNGKKYVGISIRGAKRRWARHVRDAIERNSDNLLHRAIRKHGPDAFKVRVLKRSDDWKQLCQLEVEYIAKLKTHWRHGGYNCTAGGDGIVDMPEESLARISAAASERMKRLHADPEFKAKMRRQWQDDAYRAKKSEEMRTTIQRLRAEGWVPGRGHKTAFNNFCREHGLNRKHVRRRLRKRGLHGLKDINDPRVREVLKEMIAERRADTVVPARRAQSPETLRPTLH